MKSAFRQNTLGRPSSLAEPPVVTSAATGGPTGERVGALAHLPWWWALRMGGIFVTAKANIGGT